MSFTPSTRAALRRAFYRYTATDSTDGAMTEHDDTENETVHEALQAGLGAAQRYLIDIGCGEDWLTSSAALSFSEASTGEQYATAPVDLLRFAGDERYPALRDADGRAWGQLLRNPTARRVTTGDFFFWAEKKIWLARLAAPPELYLDYYQRITLPAADVTDLTTATPSFPEHALNLIPAEAALHALHQAWFPGDRDMESRIIRARTYWRAEAASELRRTNGLQDMGGMETVGSHYFLT